MPTGPSLPPIKPTCSKPKGKTTTERGYGTEHERQREDLLRRFPLCQRCGNAWSYHLHHKDRNPFNRSPDNVEVLCVECHQAEHAGP
jgi:5-methylcytosine-specific restriction endonuclease McrA